MGDPFKSPLKLLWPSQHYCIEGFKEGPELGPHIMPRYVSPSSSQCEIFQSQKYAVDVMFLIPEEKSEKKKPEIKFFE